MYYTISRIIKLLTDNYKNSITEKVVNYCILISSNKPTPGARLSTEGALVGCAQLQLADY